MKEMKRVLSLLLCLVMLVGVLPVGALAADNDVEQPAAVVEPVQPLTETEQDQPETPAEAPQEDSSEDTDKVISEESSEEISEDSPEKSDEEASVEPAEETAEESNEVTETTNEVQDEEDSDVTLYLETMNFPVAASDEEADYVDAAIFGSDVHNVSSNVTAIFSAIKTADSTFVPSTASFVGDTQMVQSTVTTAAQSVFSNVQCIYAYGSHDTENNCTIEDVTGLIYNGTNYYIYVISQTDMASSSNASSKAAAFTSTVATLDQSKPLFIISHMPLHARRNDNNGASAWYNVISAAAESMDIVFFWAHNHTGETEVDQAAYYVAKNGSETMSIQGGSTVTPNFTYMNAGYISQSAGRGGVVTTVKIYDDSLVFQDYNNSGAYTGDYAHNVTVARAFASSTDSGDSGDGDTDTDTDSTGGTTKTVYVLTDTLTVGKNYLIANGNSGTVTLLGQSSGSSSTAEATVVTEDGYTYIETADSGYVWNATAHPNSSYSSYPRLINAETYAMYASSGSLAFSNSLTTTSGAVYTRYWTYTDGVLACPSTNSSSTTYYMTYTNNAFSLTNSSTTGIYIYEEQTITVGSDGSDGDNSGSGSEEEGGTTDTTYGEGTYTTADDESYQKVTFGTAGEEKTVYVLVSTPTAGNQYLIVSGNSAGSAYALKENTTAGSSVTINAAGNGISAPYIETSDETIMWNAASGMTFQSENDNYYLRQSNSNGSRSLSFSTTQSTDWTVGTNSLYYKGNKNTYYVSGGSTWSLSSDSANVYFYEKQTIDTSSEVTYSVSAEDIEHFYDSDDTTAEIASIAASVLAGTSETTSLNGTYSYEIVSDESSIISGVIAEDGTITFTGATGEATVKVSYTFTKDEVGYTIWDTITVTASEPTYAIEITETETDEDGNRGAGEVITETIIIKGQTAIDAGYDLWAKLTYTDSEGEKEFVVDPEKLTWSSNNTSIATVDEDGIVTFVGGVGAVQITVYYEYADGKSVTDTVTFSVSTSQYITPSDGTNDFPEYPNEGAIRIDKTAVAVGNFSETGIAQVELSMTGVPYTTGSEIDVVIMLDMTGSMTTESMAAAEASALAFARQIILNEDGTYNNNRISVQKFHVNGVTELWSLSAVTEDTYDSLVSAIESASENNASGGTPYSTALKACYEILYAASQAEGYDRDQFCVFVSDGTPTSVTYITDSSVPTNTTTVSFTRDGTTYTQTVPAYSTGSTASTFYGSTSYHEYWSQLMINNGVGVYGVYTSAAAGSSGNNSNNNNQGNGSGSVNDTTEGTNAMTNVASSSDKVYVVEDYTDTSALTGVFNTIALEIKQAATDVVVEDKIDSHYTVNFSLPSGVASTEAGMSEFYIQAVQYTLDSDKERTGDPTVLENFTFTSDGSLKSHTVDGSVCGDTCTHVTIADGKITAITGTYFQYSIDENGDEFLTWTAEKLDTTELALQYFVYLDNSAGDVDAADQVDAGTYNTNEYATITYTNFNGNECQKEFPIPSLTWNGAQVTYVFYLVNENGQPVNRAGKVVPFAEAVYVTTPVTFDVTWNEETGSENMLAQNLFASANVPSVYELYDESAYYEIRVYQTEGVDQSNNAKNYNYFIIDGSDSGLTSYETTKVFNTKAGTKYDDYGVYSAQAKGSTLYTTDADGNASTITVDYQTTDIDYANTTVAFAVVWKPALVEDTVVIDYGLPVVIDVTTNDALASGVVGVRKDAPANVEINKGTYTSARATSVAVEHGTASVESLTSVRYTLTDTTINAPVTFYYESEVNYYTYDASNNATLNTTSMYSSVTVIPATTVYYEDDFVVLKTYTDAVPVDANNDGKTDTDDYGAPLYTYTEVDGWESVGSANTSAVQDTDRPGTDKISENYDADNNYGYDSAYEECSMYSLGGAAKVTVKSGTYATAAFSFYGTGFDVISMTDTTTGTLIVKVTDVDGNIVRNTIVDTYYGYAYGEYKDENGETVEGWYTVISNDPNAIYQVPVITIEGLTYGKYDVLITASYNGYFDNMSDGSYDLYLDAIRVYDPAYDNEKANEVYVEDGEAWPVYQELRNNVIDAAALNTESGETEVAGIVFIDGANSTGAGNTLSVSDYMNYGPNNELYLAPGQAIAFNLDLSDYSIKSVQLGLKSADGEEISYKILDGSTITSKTDMDNAASLTVKTSTDMYYDITKLKDTTIVVYNSGTEGTLSLTNIKLTFTADPGVIENLFYVSAETVYNIVESMNAEEPADQTFTPDILQITTPASVIAGNKITVVVTTKTDVAAVSINGELITRYSKNSSGQYVWTAKVATDSADAGTSKTVEVVAYNASGIASAAQTATVAVQNTQAWVQTTLGKLWNTLRSWFN